MNIAGLPASSSLLSGRNDECEQSKARSGINSSIKNKTPQALVVNSNTPFLPNRGCFKTASLFSICLNFILKGFIYDLL
jgi:hypothetical protein